MKNIYKLALGLCIVLGAWAQTSHAQLDIPGQPTIYNSDADNYIQSSDMENPIREGTYAAIKNPDPADTDEESAILGVEGADNKIETHEQAKIQTFRMITNIINYALAGLATVALIYMMYHGFIILTAAGDDSKYKQGMKGIKYATIAIGGIGLSWIFVSSIFWVVSSFANGTTPQEKTNGSSYSKEIKIESSTSSEVISKD